jgi:amino acid transporter
MPSDPRPEVASEGTPRSEPASKHWLRRFLFGSPRNLGDKAIFHRLSLIPFLAWVGLGADGLSSSAYGPEEAFRTLGEHTYLAVPLAAVMAFTVLVISAAYSRIIEEFPSGGGGYIVASTLLGSRVGVVSGCALLVDYVLTITVSIAAAGDAFFSFLPANTLGLKLPVEVFFIALLTTLNIRGVRESVLILTPIFVGFLLTHAFLIGYGIAAHATELPSTAAAVGSGFGHGLSTLGIAGMLLLFVHAYSLGGGTYTGIEAVSNGLPIMREPRVETAKRTMVYMATSLAITAAGLLLCYLAWHVAPATGKTMNAVLAEQVAGPSLLGRLFVIAALLSEAAILVVAAQAGFIDGPRVLSNMAVDSWMPHRFAALSDRLTTQNGVLLMGGAGAAALVYTGGDVRQIVIMYSINVFLTFSLSLFAMTRKWVRARKDRVRWKQRASLFGVGFLLCATILVITITQKFREGGWLTLSLTGAVIALCYLIRRHYREVWNRLRSLDDTLLNLPRTATGAVGEPDASQPVAGILVAGYGGLGIHTMLSVFRTFSGHFKSVVFLSVGVLDSGTFKGEGALEALREETERMLGKYVDLARGLGIPSTSRLAIGTDVVDEAAKLCMETAQRFSRVTFFAGTLIFRRERWFHRMLHNQTAFAVQKRLQWAGVPMVILPVRVR